ncbi:MAG: nitrophenyl compound nitroreductase subunit ArsF family protein [Bacteroidales bacterium]|nr:nitrophenyl compound nitroreductase subunit ArsF family protein [Bacteroidales bacterium]
MKRTVFLNFMLMALFSGFLSSAQTQNEAKVQAYYFHSQFRCETCRTVESEAKQNLKELYGSKVSFQALNLEDKANQEIAKKLKVSGQTLLVVNGSKQVNLTNDGFLYAVTNPDKFKSVIKVKVDPLVN